jgi:myo-inositol-1(or 4)-monophosphatase
MDKQQRRIELEKILKSAHELLLEGWTPRPGAQTSRKEMLLTQNKTSFKDLVTQFDKKVEEFLLEKLNKSFSGEVFLGEESQSQAIFEKLKSVDACWVIDPIDGTTNYARAYPFFCSTIGWMEKINGHWSVSVGGIYEPLHKEIFSAARGHGATLNSEKILVTPNEDPKQALFSTGFASNKSQSIDKPFDLFTQITKESLGVRRDGSAALDLAHVACGRTDGYWEWGLAAWDIAAGALIVEEAGGQVTKHKGQKFDPFDGEILSSNGKLHPWLEKMLSAASS